MADAGSVDLLAYYRQRIEDFETERAEFLRKFKDLEVCDSACAGKGSGDDGGKKRVACSAHRFRPLVARPS